MILCQAAEAHMYLDRFAEVCMEGRGDMLFAKFLLIAKMVDIWLGQHTNCYLLNAYCKMLNGNCKF